MASATTNPTSGLQVALSEFQSILSDNDRKRLQKIKDKPEADAAIQFTATLDQENAAKRKGPSISSRLYSFLLCIQQFSNVVDTFVSSNPTIAALVWGTVKLTIKIVTNFLTYYEETSKAFVDFDKWSPRFRQYQTLFPTSTRLQAAICEFHASIIRCCKQIVYMAQRSWQAHLVASLTQNFQSELENHIRLIKNAGREVSLEVDLAKAHADVEEQQLQRQERTLASGQRLALTSFISKSNDDVAEAQKWREIVDRRSKSEHNQRQLDLISTFDHVTAFNQARSKRFHWTGDWVFRTSEWRSWIEDSSSSVCWLSGKIGSGKTVLSATITDHLLATRRVSESISFLFPRFDYSESLLADTIIRSLIRQNLQPDLVDRLQYDISKAHNSFYSQDTLLNLFLSKTAMFSTNYLIIDSLDECEPRERQTLIQILSAIIKRSSSKVKLFITSRDNLGNELTHSIPQVTRLRMNAPEAAADLELFAHQTLSERMNMGQLAVGSIVSFEEICDAIVKGAQGMFIWVALEIDDICSQVCEEDVVVALQNIPPTFTGILSRALLRILSQGHQRIARKAFTWISVTKRPLLLDELQDALSIRVGESYSKPERLPQTMENLPAWCANLVEIDELSKTVQFIHHSVRAFILDTSIVEEQSPELNQFHHDLQNLEITVGELCVTYLEWNDFKRALQPSSHKSVQKVKAPEPRSIIQTTLAAGWQSQTLSRLIPRSQRHQKELKIPGSRSRGRDSYYPFLEYAKEHWLLHTGNLPTESPIYSSWRWMLRGGHPIAKTEWTELEYLSADESVLAWTTAHCHIALLFEIRSAGYLDWDRFYEYSCKIIVNSRSLQEVMRYLNRVVEHIPSYWTCNMVDNIKMDMMGVYLLSQGNIDWQPEPYTIKTYSDKIALLDIETNLRLVSDDHDLLEIVYWASVQLCLAELMSTLLSNTGLCKVPDFVYIEPLYVAILAEDATAVKLLLGRGANPNASCTRNNWPGFTENDCESRFRFRSPLHLAVNLGNTRIMRLLLTAGADVECSTYHFQPASDYEFHCSVVSQGPIFPKRTVPEHVGNSENPLPALPGTGYEDLETQIPSGSILVIKTTKLASNKITMAEATLREMLESCRTLFLNNLTLLHYAILLSIDDISNGLDLGPTKLLLTYSADPNAIAAGGVTPILLAINQRQRETFRVLLDAGADPTIPLLYGGQQTAEEFAYRIGFDEVADVVKPWHRRVRRRGRVFGELELRQATKRHKSPIYDTFMLGAKGQIRK